MTNPTKFISIYARVSTANQEEQQTIKTQLSTLYDYAEKNNLTIVKEYVDEGWSGDTLARPSLDMLRQDAKSKAWEAVLIYDPDRLARRYSYQELVTDELHEAGAEVIFITVPAPRNSEDKILHGVRGLFAEYERTKISERFRLGKVRKVKEGHLLVSEPLYGYRYIPRKDLIHGYYEINPDEADVVKLLFKWVADEKLNLRKVVRRLMELGIKPRKSKRGVWSTSTLSKMYRNRAYIGEAHWGASYGVVPLNTVSKEKYRKNKKSSRRARPENEWYTIPVPPIIDKDLFERARLQIEENFKLCQRNAKNDYLLKGKMFCTCGAKRTGEGVLHGKHLYYRCSNRVLNYPLPKSCNEMSINARLADDLVWQGVAGLMSSPELMMAQIQRWLDSRNKKTPGSLDDIEILEKELSKLKTEEDRYNKAYGAGLITIEKLSEYIIPLRARASSLHTQILKSRDEKSQSQEIKMPQRSEIEKFATVAAQTLNSLSFQSKQGIIHSVIEKIVGTKERLEISGHIPIINQNHHVVFFTSHRYDVNTSTHNQSDKNPYASIPFQFEVDIP